MAEASWLMDGCAGVGDRPFPSQVVGGKSTAAGKASDPVEELGSVAELADADVGAGAVACSW